MQLQEKIFYEHPIIGKVNPQVVGDTQSVPTGQEKRRERKKRASPTWLNPRAPSPKPFTQVLWQRGDGAFLARVFTTKDISFFLPKPLTVITPYIHSYLRSLLTSHGSFTLTREVHDRIIRALHF